jgi:hypothetical protein
VNAGTWAAAIALLAMCGAPRAADNDWLIVPGKRVGPITAKTVHADLAKAFGIKNVVDEEVMVSDTGAEEGTTVFGEQAETALTILWNDDTPEPHIRRIVFCQGAERCRWHTEDGISFGTTLKALESKNGRKFKLYGFDWGHGGLVTSWDGGRLERLAATCGHLNLRLDPPAGPASDERAKLLEQVEGDIEFWSSEPAMQALNPVVDFMGVVFPKGCDKSGSLELWN